MLTNIFATYRAEPLSTWLVAFPSAMVIAPGGVSALPSATVLVWLHLGMGNDIARLIQDVRVWAPRAPIIVLSNRPTPDEGMAALEAGAAGYANALAAPEVLHQIVDVVENGGTWVGQELLHRLLAALARQGGKREVVGMDKLTEREREVALAVASGASNKEISAQLNITERTVKSHLSAIFQILGVRDRLQLSILVNGIPGSLS